MALPDLSTTSPLRHALKDCGGGHLTYLLGAGASTPSNLPTWNTLLTRLLSTRHDPEAIAAILTGQDNLLAAEAAFDADTTVKDRQKAIYQALYETDSTTEAEKNFAPSPLHLAVAKDAVRRGAASVSLLTLNYDDLLEEAVTAELATTDEDPAPTAEAAAVHPRASAAPRAAPGTFEVHHLHGLLPRESTTAIGDDLVLSLRDYNQIIEQTSSWQQTELAQCLQRGPLLMLGTSYSDPDVRAWLHRLRSDNAPPTYLVLPRQSLQLSADLTERLTEVIVAQWHTVGVECLIVDDYAEMTQLVREMPHLNRTDYQPPRQRVAAVLEARLQDFDATQEADYTRLAQQAADDLHDVIGSPANLTLWLLDKDAKLVRWAANDRVYKSVPALRRIDPQLESSWIVSQAVCFGDQRIQDIRVESSTPARTERTGRWQSVLARPLTVALPGGPQVTVGALSAASQNLLQDIDTEAWNAAMAGLAAWWEAQLSQGSPT